MNILWVSPIRLIPVDAGARIRTTNTVRELRKRHTVKVVSLYRNRRPDLRFEGALASEFPGGEAIWLGKGVRASVSYRFPGRLTSVLTTDFSRNRRAAARVDQLLRSGNFEVAVCDFVFGAPQFPARIPIPSVLYQHNVEWHRLASESTTRSSGITRPLEAWAVRRLKRFEAAQVARFDHTLAVSDEDANLLRALVPGVRVTSIGTGVDLAEHRPAPLPAASEPLVVFTGVMSYFPNVDAVRWFCAAIWPRVLAAVPEARFRIVGRNPSAAVRSLASSTVEVTGRVDSVADHLREASAVVVPLRSGGGTRLKIYEALATGRPMVSTRKGAEGLDVTDGHDIVFAEEAEQFAREVISLLTDQSRAEALAAGAAKTGAANGWPAVGDRFEAVLEGLVARFALNA